MIYHIATSSEWSAFDGQPYYAPTAYEREGFIHASRFHQLEGVLSRYYQGRTDLLLLKIDEQKLTCQVLYEPGTYRELFPHIYGTINKEAVVDTINPFNADILEALKSFR